MVIFLGTPKLEKLTLQENKALSSSAQSWQDSGMKAQLTPCQQSWYGRRNDIIKELKVIFQMHIIVANGVK